MERSIPSSLALLLLASAPASAQKLTSQDVLPGDRSIAPSIGTQDDPAISAGGGQYLVVYEDERLSRTVTVGGDPWEVIQTDLYGARLDAAGAVIDAVPIVVDSSPYSQENPSVAWNGANWLVAYEARSVIELGTATDVDIHAVRVSPDGSITSRRPRATRLKASWMTASCL